MFGAHAELFERANSLAAAQAGATRLHGAALGVGERGQPACLGRRDREVAHFRRREGMGSDDRNV